MGHKRKCMIETRCIVFYTLYRIVLTVSSLLCCVTEHITMHSVARQHVNALLMIQTKISSPATLRPPVGQGPKR